MMQEQQESSWENVSKLEPYKTQAIQDGLIILTFVVEHKKDKAVGCPEIVAEGSLWSSEFWEQSTTTFISLL